MDYTNTDLTRLTKSNTSHYLRSIFDHSSFGIALVDDAGKLFLVNTTLCQMLGFSEAELTTMTFDQCTHPEDVNKDDSLYDQLIKNELSEYSIEKRFISKAGHIGHLKWKMTRIDGEKDGEWHVLAQAEEVSPGDQFNQETTPGEWMKALDMAQIGLWEVDLETNEVSWSKPVYEIHGVPEEQPIDLERALGFLHHESRDRAQEIINRAIETRTPWNEELKVVTAQGIEKWVKTVGHPEVKNHRTVRMRGLIQDITALKEASNQSERTNSVPEQTVKELTERSEKAIAELDAFAYSVSHDLRAPLRAIDGFSNALMEDYLDQLPETAQHYLTRITNNSTRMGQLIDSLLSLSRVSRHETLFQTLDLGDRIASVLHEMNPSSHYQITTEGMSDLYGDRVLLDQLLHHLLSNAIKYSSQESAPKIHIRQTSHQDSDEITISDNGIGFDMTYHDKLFEIFQRLHTEQDFEGTGIGLAICQKIVARHQGKIWAESKIGDGTVFYVSLPKGTP